MKFFLALFAAILQQTLVVTVPQLVAAWAAVSRAPPLGRSGAAAAAFAVAWLLVLNKSSSDALIVLVGLGMVLIALVLTLARWVAEGRFRFTLGEIFRATTACALLLALFLQPPVLRHLPTAELAAAAGVYFLVTLASIWAAISRSPARQRAIGLGLLLVGGAVVLSIAYSAPAGFIVFFTQLLALHAALVLAATALWSRTQARKAMVTGILEPAREPSSMS